ncbi:MAG: UDP-N-acetylmuramoyl-tripeptide--D-alanyl-D-alanine ligase, partial [Pseudomonadota bacterium]|nr:UDP-N-acetylmuramoyl-tripeptide--D-alanyl-D-alanine ligase [Pseudomonadota bacterium]
QRFAIPVIAVTGSNGKTTVTALTASILNQTGPCLSPEGSFNNHWGVPLTLLRLRDSHRTAVLELGMNHPGEIRYLTGLVRPTIALINNAAPAHLAGLGDVQGVARAKGEIFEGLSDSGVAIINADDPFAGYWRQLAGAHKVVTFGIEQPADLWARDMVFDDASRFRLCSAAGEIEVALPLAGRHNVMNALAAAAAAQQAGADLGQIRAGLARAGAVRGRLQRRPGAGGALVIDDSYNANPASMRAALEVLAARSGQRIAVLGSMAELGEDSFARHRALGEQARELGIERLLFLDEEGGEASSEAVRAFGSSGELFDDADQLAAAVRLLLTGETTVLVKGSRAARMERIADKLALPVEEAAC